ncbi:MAG: SixA phosphatase family protein, partial [Phycisphaerales bacterium]
AAPREALASRLAERLAEMRAVGPGAVEVKTGYGPDDALRPLTRDGARDFERLARRMRRWKPDVDLVLASGWTRAWDTARILRANAGWPKPARTKLLETSDPRAVPTVAALVREQPEDARLALVGHEPVLGLLVAELCGAGAEARISMRKGSIAWLRGAPGRMELRGLLVPGMMRGE